MNTPAEYGRVAEVYAAVFDLPAGERATRVAALCGGDSTLRLWVEDLLAADDDLRAAEASGSGPRDLLGRGADTAFAAPRLRQLEAGTIAAGRYRIVGLIGRGGASEVYSADDLLLEQAVALKFLASKAQVRARAAALLQEVRLARRVRHPNVCQIFDVGEADGDRFISMELVGGPNLAEELRRIGRFARPKAIHIAHQLCSGLSAIHAQGIVHGDLKPANVMLDERGDVRILDFGISEARGSVPRAAAAESRERKLIGTPAYLAPERWQGEGATVASDLYALGLVLYEVFSGERAVRADSALAYREEHEAAEPEPLSSLAEDVDGTVESIVERCLSKNPSERPASAIEVARALPGGDVLGGLVLAGVLPTPERVAEGSPEPRLSQRAVAALASLLVVLLVAAALAMPRAHLVEGSDLPIAPVALADRAERILRQLGYAELPHTAYGFGVFEGASRLLFWFRASPAPLEANVLESSVELSDPPFTEAGMVGVVLTPGGDLRTLISVGPDPPPRPGGGEAARELFRAAGLDAAAFTATAPAHGRFLHRGLAVAWVETSGASPRWRVEASEEHGRPVYFEAVKEGEAPLWESGQPRSAFRRPIGAFLRLFAVGALLVAAVLARRNFRRGVVDRLGARRTAIFVLLLALAHGVTDAINAGSAALHLRLLLYTLQRGALFASATWIFYAALEPLFRGYWPHGLVTWTRLVRGRLTDPTLGRDVLAGGCIGCLAVLFEAGQVSLAERLAGAAPLAPTVEQLRSLSGAWGALAAVLAAMLGAVVLGWVQLSLLVLLRRLLGPGVGLILGFALVLTAGNALFDPAPWPALCLQFAFWAIATPFFVRFGFTMMVSGAFFYLTMTHLPTTLDPAQWYFPTSVAGFAMLLSLAGFGAYTAGWRSA